MASRALRTTGGANVENTALRRHIEKLPRTAVMNVVTDGPAQERVNEEPTVSRQKKFRLPSNDRLPTVAGEAA